LPQPQFPFGSLLTPGAAPVRVELPHLATTLAEASLR